MFKRSVIAMACIFALSACGGGGGGSPDVKSADTLSKPAAPVVSEKETEAKEDAPQAGSQGQGAPSTQGSQDMAAVSAENTGNGGAATTDTPKNEDEGAQDDMPQKAAGTDSLTPNHTPAPNMPAGDMGNQAPDNGESAQPANQPDAANAGDGIQGDDPSAGENAGNTASAESANQTGNNQPAGSSDSAPASNPAPANGGSNFGRVDLANGIKLDSGSENVTLTHCKDTVCGSDFLDEEAPSKSEFESLSDEKKIEKYKKDGEKFTNLVATEVQANGVNKYVIIYKDKSASSSSARFRRSARSRRSLPAEMPLIPVNQADTLIIDGEAVSLTGHSGNIFAPEGNYRYLTYGAEKLSGGSYALRVQGEPAKGEMLAGTAVYNGEVLHFHMENGRPSPSGGRFAAKVDFGSKSVDGIIDSGDDLHMGTQKFKAVIDGNGFKGTWTENGGGDVSGRFYGPAGEEVAGKYSYRPTDAEKGGFGVFAGKKEQD
ncbi:TPA: transferrin-binding protein-like solute binding protein [Neisseria meningitidis]|uniref:Gna2132 n=1 Tax=Neisseria meningitidis TaxID=487 RepID=H9NIU9_NEIME|nr:transferrin-binding protein-like solute binding protein [Neisseria meningitidis]KER38669.1 transferrin binding -like solute binding family protein [Neisseria meningitidis 992008]AFF59564.1 Gna2132 [Neisseria meningitidis]MBW3904720.1 transferrin-binding protein-like solute binding protein [Neisseria meningitidis]MBW3910794.1 transferrin-binding protein-like solute binding protein [Neisseria meningitidis]MBW3914768.1 transferrin-binding protein-like solute binding protein [Neisseria meningit